MPEQGAHKFIPESVEPRDTETDLNTLRLTPRQIKKIHGELDAVTAEHSSAKLFEERLHKMAFREDHPLENTSPYDELIAHEVAFIKHIEKSAGDENGQILHYQDKVRNWLVGLKNGRDQIVSAIKHESKIVPIDNNPEYHIGEVVDGEIKRLEELLRFLES